MWLAELDHQRGDYEWLHDAHASLIRDLCFYIANIISSLFKRIYNVGDNAVTVGVVSAFWPAQHNHMLIADEEASYGECLQSGSWLQGGRFRTAVPHIEYFRSRELKFIRRCSLAPISPFLGPGVFFNSRQNFIPSTNHELLVSSFVSCIVEICLWLASKHWLKAMLEGHTLKCLLIQVPPRSFIILFYLFFSLISTFFNEFFGVKLLPVVKTINVRINSIILVNLQCSTWVLQVRYCLLNLNIVWLNTTFPDDFISAQLGQNQAVARVTSYEILEHNLLTRL